MPLIDINTTLGAGFGVWQKGMDDAMLRIVTSASVACGFHAGDPTIMQAAVSSAQRAGVIIGAEIGYPDLQGFGMRDIAMTTYDIYVSSLYQIGALWAICQANGAELQYVKPHGALYRRGCVEAGVAKSIARAVKNVDKNMILLAHAGSCFEKAAAELKVTFIAEIFADRGYREDGLPIARGELGDTITDPSAAGERMAAFAKEGVVRTSSGENIPVKAQSIGVHGDYKTPAQIAFAVKETLENNGFTIVNLQKIRESMPPVD